MGVDSMSIDLSHTRTLEEAVKLIEEGSEKVPEGQWVIATGWRESAWKNGRFITKRDLDKCCPDKSVVAYRICGHLCSVNSQAISELSLEPRTPGVETDSQGSPTGVLCESAVELCRNETDADAKTRLRGLSLATSKAYRLGVTSITDNGSTADLAAYVAAAREGELGVRVYFNVPSTQLNSLLDLGISTGVGDSWLRLGGLKIFCDGALGARSAALSKPYSDDKDNKGMLVRNKRDLDDLTSRAHEAGLQLAIHAIGDVGIGVAIKSIASALERDRRRNHRHRIEHLELPTPAHINAMRRMGLIASMQPNFVGEWGGTGGMYISRLGHSRTSRNNPFREILDAGVRLVFGSDCMPFFPMYGLSSATNAPFPAQKISPIEALAAYTRDASFSSFEEKNKGTLEEGKLADFAVLSGNPLQRQDLSTLRVIMTVIGGRIVYRAPRAN